MRRDKVKKPRQLQDGGEAIAETYLRYLGFTDIASEPDGNTPPDLLLNGRIAIEVRRLNQNFAEEGRIRSLDETRIPFFSMIERIAASFGEAENDQKWSITTRLFRAPNQTESRQMQKEIKKWISEFDASPETANTVFENECAFLRISPSWTQSTAKFSGGFGTDHRATVFPFPIMVENINLCIEEKVKKTSHYRDRHPEWWLFLIDTLSFGLDLEAQSRMRNEVVKGDGFHKITIVDPQYFGRSFDL